MYWPHRAERQVWQKKAGQAEQQSQGAKQGQETCSPRFVRAASIQVICWVKLVVHAQIVYPGKEEEAGEPRETKGPERWLGEPRACGPAYSWRAGRSGQEQGSGIQRKGFLLWDGAGHHFQP